MPAYTRGFTLIELMIVIAILGILLAIAIPAYQDYTIRTRLSEGLSLASGAKNSVGELRLQSRLANWPTTNAEAGIPGTIDSSVVEGITVGAGGVITISFNALGGGRVAQGDTMTLSPTYVADGGTIAWSCNGNKGFGTPGSVSSTLLPASCRP